MGLYEHPNDFQQYRPFSWRREAMVGEAVGFA